jgi:hypothetical protein
MHSFGRKVAPCLLMLGWLLPLLALAQEGATQPHVGRAIDSSYHHLVVSGGLQPKSLAVAKREPRILIRLAERNLDGVRAGAMAPVLDGDEMERIVARLPFATCRKIDGTCPSSTQRKNVKVDWSVSLGTGSVGPTMYPVKYAFNLNANPNCESDFAAFALNVAGVTGGQANVVGINQLYSGTSPTGLCGTTPHVNWAYNGSTAGGSIRTSAQVSTDGTKIVYVESAAGSSIFHILTWKAGEGSSATTAAAPTAQGSCTAASSCLVSLTYSSTSTTTLASPWVDYNSDKAFVASDDGKVYRLSCAFNCPLNTAPTIDWTFTLPVAGTGGAKPVPNGPVFDASTTRIVIGDQLGELWALNAGNTPSLFAGPVMIGGGGCTTTNPPGRTGTPTPCTASGGSYGIPDSVLLDASVGKVFAFSGNDGTAGSSAVVAQLNENLTGVVRVHIGRGSVANTTTNVDIHDGTFDNNYFGATPSSGHLFMCGTGAGNTSPSHYWIGFTSYPTMNSATTGTLSRGFSNGIPCTPYSEVYNPNIALGGNAADHDMLVSGLVGAGTNGYIITNDISNGNVTSALNLVNYPGGISAVIIDNVSTQAQASSVYFSTITNSAVGTCANTHCAVKLTQSALQ